MAIRPLDTSSRSLSSRLSEPNLSLFHQIEQLIENYQPHRLSEEESISSVKRLIEEICALDETQISLKREMLCHLLQLNIVESQKLVLEKIGSFFGFETWHYDLNHSQAEPLLHLEGVVSQIIEEKILSERLECLKPIICLYQNILEHLWILSHLESGNLCSKLLEGNQLVITRRVEKWVEKLHRLLAEGKIDGEGFDSVEKSIKLTLTPLPSELSAVMCQHKTYIAKNGCLFIGILFDIARFYQEEGILHRAILHLTTYIKLKGPNLIESLAKSVFDIREQRRVFLHLIDLHRQLASCYLLVGEYGKAVLRGEKALELARCLDDHDVLFDLLGYQGLIHLEQEKGEKSIPLFLEALELVPRLTSYKDQLPTLSCLGEAYFATGQYAAAARAYEKALTLPESKFEKGSIFISIGRSYHGMGRYDESLSAYHKALQYLRPEDALRKGEAHQNLGFLYLSLGQYDLAIIHTEEALKIATNLSPPIYDAKFIQSYYGGIFQSRKGALVLSKQLETAALGSQFAALTVLGSIYGTLGDYDRDLECQMKALAIATKMKSSEQLIKVYNNLGNTYSYMKKHSESLKYRTEAFRLARLAKDLYTQRTAQVNIGTTLLCLKRYSEAIQHFEQAIEVNDAVNNSHCLNGLGIAHADMGNKDQAIKWLEKSVQLARVSKDRLTEASVHHNLGEVYQELKDFPLAEQNFRKSIDIFVDLQKTLGNYSQWQITIFEEQVEPYIRLESLLIDLGRVNEAFKISEQRRARALNFALLRKFPSEQQTLISSQNVTFAEAQEYAKNHHTILIFYSFVKIEDGKIVIWAISPTGKPEPKIVSSELIKEELDDLVKLFKGFPFMNLLERTSEKTESAFSTSSNPRLEAIKERARKAAIEGFKQKLRNWYQALIAPIEAELMLYPHQTLTIIPDGYLFRLPFAIFLDKDGKYLIEKHPIALAPSLKFLQLLSLLKSEPLSQDYLIMGNPDTGDHKDQLEKAEREAVDLGHFLHVDHESLFVQKKATVESALERLPQSKWIHLACHGLPGPKLEPHSVFEGAFKLAPTKAYPQGYLYAQKIVELKLRAELVFLNACYSGVGKIKQEGSVGHTWSFLAAGAQSVIAAHWRVPETDLTLEMIKTFYKHLQGPNKTSKAEAIRQAMLLGLRENQRENPHVWGMFFLSGLN